MFDKPDETLPQTIHNYIARSLNADTAGVCLYLTTCHGQPLPAILAAIDALESAGDITRTASGAYALTSHLRYHLPLSAPAELVLTSCDKDFGQPSLF